MPLDITQNFNDDKSELTVSLSGRLDTLSSPQLDDELTHSTAGLSALIFDMANLRYVSSSGLRLLLKYQTTMKKQGTMTIRNVRKEIMNILNITGFNKFLNIE